jgi:hypothetical protein
VKAHLDHLSDQTHQKGEKLKKISMLKWINLIEKSLIKQTPLPMAPYLVFLKENIQSSDKTTLPIVECKQTLSYLKKGGINYPAIDEKLLQTYYTFLKKN